MELDFNLKETINILIAFILIAVGFNILHTFVLFISLNIPIDYFFTITWQDLLFNNFNFILIANVLLQLLSFYGLSYLIKWISKKISKILLLALNIIYLIFFFILTFVFFISLQLYYLSLFYFIGFLIFLMFLYFHTSRRKLSSSKKLFLWITCYVLIVSFVAYTQNQKNYFANQRYPIKVTVAYTLSNNKNTKSISLVPIKHYRHFLVGLAVNDKNIIILPQNKINEIKIPFEKSLFKKSRLYQDWIKLFTLFRKNLSFNNKN